MYLAGLVEHLRSFVTFLAVTSFIVFAITVFASYVAREEATLGHKSFTIPLLIAGIFFGFFGAVIPSQRTMILIAASEFGEKIASTKAVSDMVDPSVNLLKTWMEKQTLDLKDEITKATAKKDEGKK